MNTVVEQAKQHIIEQRDPILSFFREIVAIPSMESDIEAVGARVGAEMRKLGFDEVYTDRYGSIVGRIGNGPRILLYDSHLDTVGIGDRAQWAWDPFEGKVEEGRLYARGALDEKGSTPGMIYGMALARQLGLLANFTLYYLGNIEEWCDGIACAAFHDWEGVRPDMVVIGEPTNMKVYRGHKGRVELEVSCRGVSAHAASNYLGDNAIYKMLPLIEGISRLEEQFVPDDFLGIGRITVTRIGSRAASDNAVPEECRIFIDRRVTFGESRESVIAEIEALIPAEQREVFEIHTLTYRTPSHTGAVYEYEQYFPAWALDKQHPLVRAGEALLHELWQVADVAGQGKWDFSTNGNYWAGKLGIPCIGFGPGNEIYAHAINEHVPLDDVVDATLFYALLPWMLDREGR
ncbi:MAG: YgeY family selenium metabolism-linked hydrolase [Anaerolineales bacterium]|nr:YgeY family selenium metabolism-linked hydrolase [Anaerolineales bacterium]MCB9126735.1 YgeY family selenium metabolism-linked hydrolase [Ardenticatenales bacterium]